MTMIGEMNQFHASNPTVAIGDRVRVKGLTYNPDSGTREEGQGAFTTGDDIGRTGEVVSLCEGMAFGDIRVKLDDIDRSIYVMGWDKIVTDTPVKTLPAVGDKIRVISVPSLGMDDIQHVDGIATVKRVEPAGSGAHTFEGHRVYVARNGAADNAVWDAYFVEWENYTEESPYAVGDSFRAAEGATSATTTYRIDNIHNGQVDISYGNGGSITLTTGELDKFYREGTYVKIESVAAIEGVNIGDHFIAGDTESTVYRIDDVDGSNLKISYKYATDAPDRERRTLDLATRTVTRHLESGVYKRVPAPDPEMAEWEKELLAPMPTGWEPFKIGFKFKGSQNDSTVYTVTALDDNHMTVTYVSSFDNGTRTISALAKSTMLSEWNRGVYVVAEDSAGDTRVAEDKALRDRIRELEDALATADQSKRDAVKSEQFRIIQALDSEAEARDWCSDYDSWLREHDLTEYSSRVTEVELQVTATFTVTLPADDVDRHTIFNAWTPTAYDIDDWESI